jgi:acyl carrier protein
MDALAGRSGARLPWVSANWDRWPTIRAAGTYTETRSSIDRFAFDAKEAAETLGWLTGRAWRGQVVVSAGDLSSRLARWVGQAPARESRPSPLSAADDFAPAPVPARRDSTPGGVPADSIEAGLIALWRDLIGAREIGLRDNFFEIGGDSLIGIQLIAHVGRAFGVRLPVDSLFEYPTITGLADCVRRLREELPRSAGPPALMLSHGLEEGEI